MRKYGRNGKKNKEKLNSSGHIKVFLEYRKQKLNEHDENMIRINEEKNQIQEISRAILLKKGYDDPSLLKDINYSLVEESSPKYSIKGKIIPKITNYEDFGNILMNDNEETLQAIKKEQLNRPLPNLDYVRPKLPSISFSKAQRFKKTKEYEGPTYLFKDGIFEPKTQEDFFIKEPFSGLAQRPALSKKDGKITPSPADYKIKSSFEIIAEQGKKISDNKKKIQMKEMKERQEKENIKQIMEPSKDLNLNNEKRDVNENNLILKIDDNEEVKNNINKESNNK